MITVSAERAFRDDIILDTFCRCHLEGLRGCLLTDREGRARLPQLAPHPGLTLVPMHTASQDHPSVYWGTHRAERKAQMGSPSGRHPSTAPRGSRPPTQAVAVLCAPGKGAQKKDRDGAGVGRRSGFAQSMPKQVPKCRGPGEQSQVRPVPVGTLAQVLFSPWPQFPPLKNRASESPSQDVGRRTEDSPSLVRDAGAGRWLPEPIPAPLAPSCC